MNIHQIIILVVAVCAGWAWLRWGEIDAQKEEHMISNFLKLVTAKGFFKAVILIVIAAFFGVTITPAVHLASAPDVPSLPTILGMSLGDFLTWVVSSGVIGVVLAAAFAKATWIPANVAEILVVVLSAMFGSAITAAIPFIASDVLGKSMYAVLLMIASGLVTWLGSIFGAHAIASISQGDFKLSDRALKIAGVTLVLVLSFIVGIAVPMLSTPSVASAETYDQMVYRMFATKQAAHPEIWNACDAKCVSDVRATNDWWLKPLLAKINTKFPSYAKPATLDDLTRYAIVRANEIAIRADEDCREGVIRDEQSRGKWPTQAQFDKCKVTAYWWNTQYANNVEQTRADFDVSPVIFPINEWPPLWKVSRDYAQ